MWEGIRKKLGQKNKKNKKTSPSAFLGSRGRASSPSARTAALGEASIFPECQDSALGKELFPRVFFWHSGNNFFYFKLQRRRLVGTSWNTFLPRERLFPECCARGRWIFPSVILPRVSGWLGLSGKSLFPECISSLRATLGKDWLPRVLDFWLSGKPLTLGKFRFSRSVHRPQLLFSFSKELFSFDHRP